MDPDTARGGEIPAVSRSHGLVLRSVDKEGRSAEFVASTDSIDSYDEIVEQTWDLKRYRSNPVVLFAHASRELPIGTASNVAVKDGALVCTIKFASEKANPKAEQVWQGVQEGTLRAVSVGFNPKSYRWEKRDEREVLVLSDNELFEISVVPIPANPDALMKMRAKAHEARASKENLTMDKEEEQRLRGAVAEKDAALGIVKKDLEDTKVKLTALEAQNKALEADRDAKAKELAEVREKAIGSRVESLIERKLLLPAEKDTFVKLARVSPDIFEELIAQRTPHAITEPKLPSDPAPQNKSAAPIGSDDLAAEVARMAAAGDAA